MKKGQTIFLLMRILVGLLVMCASFTFMGWVLVELIVGEPQGMNSLDLWTIVNSNEIVTLALYFIVAYIVANIFTVISVIWYYHRNNLSEKYADFEKEQVFSYMEPYHKSLVLNALYFFFPRKASQILNKEFPNIEEEL